MSALTQANVWNDVKNLPQGIHSRLGDDSGIYLSTSMALRLCIARAYLHNAPVLLIDELPNSLMNDPAGKELVESIIRLKRGRTIFMVSYRNDLMSVADHVIVLRRRKAPVVGPARLVLQKLKELS